MNPRDREALRRRTEYYLSLPTSSGGASVELTSSAPVDVTTSAAAVGVSDEAARADHKHDVSTAAAVTLTATTTNAEGTADTLARSDHTHDITTAAAASLTTATANAEGTATTLARSDHTHEISESGTVTTIFANDDPFDGSASGFARKDHQHGVETGAPTTGIGGSNAEGTSNAFARADHNHRLRTTTGPTDLAIAGIADGQYVIRSGTTLIGTDPPSGGAALTSTAPVDVTKAAAAVGVGVEAARNDHKHDVSTAAASGLSAATTNTEGSATSVARSDHTHAIDATTGTLSTINAADTAVDGTATGFARRDHQHAVSTASPSTGIGGANSEGTATSLARSDHNHTLRETGGPQSLTIGAIADGEYVVRTGTALVGTPPPSGGTTVTSTAPVNVTKAAAAVGTSVEAARADHKHDITTAAAVTLTATTANAEGTADTLSRSDHTHDITTASPSTGIGGANSEGTATTLARSDHNHTLRETGGPQSLTIGAIAEGQYLARSGTAIIGVTTLALTSSAPEHVDMTPAAVGVSTTAARADHKHDTNTGTPVGLTADSANAQGASQNLSPAEHTHSLDVTTGTLSTVNAGDTAASGTAAGLARRDHQHAVATAQPASPSLAVGGSPAEGTSTFLSRADHVHPVIVGVAVSLNANSANGTGAGVGGLAAADHTHDIDTATGTISTVNAGDAAAEGSAAGIARRDHQHAVATAAPVASSVVLDGSNSEGTSTSLARSDHVHNLAAAAPSSVGIGNSEGVATSVARSDHVHNHGSQAVETHHSLTSSTAAGFQPRSNRTATAAPTAGDDSGDGYGVGSYWPNTVNGRVWMRVNDASVLASWQRIGHDITQTVAWGATISFNVNNYDDLVVNTAVTANTQVTLTNGLDNDRGKVFMMTTNASSHEITFIAAGRTTLYLIAAPIEGMTTALRAYVWDYRFATLGGTPVIIITVYSLGGYAG